MSPCATIVMLFALFLCTCLLAQTAPAPPAGLGPPQHLRCEYLVNPLGIDAAAPRLSWLITDDRRGARQTAYRVLVAGDAARLARDEGDRWDSGRVESSETAHIVYAGRPLCSKERVWWKVQTWDAEGRCSPWSAAAKWSMGLLAPEDWGAEWIGDAREVSGIDPAPPPMFRKSFDPGGPITRATVYITALGLYELRINGRRVGDHILAPEWTDYARRVQYQTYDVTDLIRAGENVLGVQLGDGWYCGRIGLTQIVPNGRPRRIYGDHPQLLLRLEIERRDGRVVAVVSDGSWKSTTEGPIRVADLLDGEIYDATREQPGWDAPGFDDASWTPVRVIARPGEPNPGLNGPAAPPGVGGRGPALVAQPNEPIRITRELSPVALTEPQPGVYVFDLGQNTAGWCRLKLRKLPAGTTVTLRHAEVLNPDGTLYTANLRSAKQTDQYTGPGDCTFEPHFTYHGFRYVEVTGLPYQPAATDLTGCVFHSAAPETGGFECSEPLLNRLYQNIVWTQRANLTSIPTDCPQRDERLGWMGDILAFAPTACFTMDMAAFFRKWILDVRDAQTSDGRYPDFAPHPFDPATRFSSVPAWGDAGVFVPWTAYVWYGDRRLLEEHFDSARRWVDYVHAQNPDLLWKNSRGNDYGDWLNADTLKLAGWPARGAEVPKEVFGTMFFARSTQLVARMAEVLGRTEDARRYAARADEIRAAIQRAYVQPDGVLTGDTQAGYAIALAFDLLPAERQDEALRRMIAAFDRYGGNISTGFHSTICLMNELTGRGRADEAYRLLLNRTLPSWLYPVEHGATTIWERWDGYVEGRGFQDPGMNSFAHYAYGCVGEWMFRTILGINPDEQQPGFAHFTLRPLPGGGLTWARGYYDSLNGRIESAWRIDGDRVQLAVTVPANTSATLILPTGETRELAAGRHTAVIPNAAQRPNAVIPNAAQQP